MSTEVVHSIERLQRVLHGCGPVAIAVSGGVDSMTLAHVAQRTPGIDCTMFHAVSPAVPPRATALVERHAAAHAWRLVVIDALEFADPRYRANPANRCFFCKTNLYDRICAGTAQQVVSGTNLDDLGDWRPGLTAAAAHGVRHPFVEAALDKAAVRRIARHYALDDIAELPAAPCLSSRVETGIRIEPAALAFIDAAEQCVQRMLAPPVVRCRIRARGVEIEMDGASRKSMSEAQREALTTSLEALGRTHGIRGTITFADYTRGSAFLREPV